MVIRRAEKKDYIIVARLHSEGITSGFLSTLGTTFLSYLYEAINHHKESCVFVAEHESEVCGYIAGTANTGNLYKEVILSKWYLFVPQLLKYLSNAAIVKKIAETLFYGLKAKKDSAKRPYGSSELLSIAIRKDYRGKHIGKRLVDSLESFLISRKVNRYKVVTSSVDKQSNGFYKACNFEFSETFMHHNNEMNVYCKELV